MLTNSIWSRFEIVNILYKNTDMFIYIRIKISFFSKKNIFVLPTIHAISIMYKYQIYG